MWNRLPNTTKVVVKLLIVFVVLSLADFFLTLRLIESGDGDVLESNPVAQYWYAAHGWAGMAGFKLAMVALVGALAVGISFGRRRTGEMVVIFACGAQAAIVFNSILLDRLADNRVSTEPASMRVAAETPGFLQLVMPAVQRELELSAVQIEEILSWREQRRKVNAKLSHLREKEWNSKVYELLEAEAVLLDNLSSRQRERLQQIVWQLQRIDAFRDEEVLSVLVLSDDQRQHINDILDAPDLAKRGAPFRGQRSEDQTVADVYPEPMTDILALLTPHQRSLWDVLIGPPFVHDSVEVAGAQ